jgi:hypothetical protein
MGTNMFLLHVDHQRAPMESPHAEKVHVFVSIQLLWCLRGMSNGRRRWYKRLHVVRKKGLPFPLVNELISTSIKHVTHLVGQDQEDTEILQHSALRHHLEVKNTAHS